MKPCSLSQETPMVDEALLEDPSPASASNSKQLKCNDVKQKLKKTSNKLYREREKFKRWQRQQLSLEDRRTIMIEELRNVLPFETADFVIKQVQLIKKKKLGRRWSEHDKSVALSLYHTSKKCYKLLMKLFILPSASTLRKCMRGINIYPGLNQGLLEALGQKINSLPSGSEVCSLVFDEISLKEGVTYNVERDEIEGLEDFEVLGKSKLLANHANVFMVRGLKVNWKQPVGYVLSSGPIDSFVLKQLLFDCLDKLHEIGLNVKCVIADQGSNNQKLFSKLLHIDKDRPYFMYNSRKYFVL
ncbi:transposable element p transposase [Plakobranchus ocellatus]|uniref:Transposable element p transposase n=1 Tax=Plakobranchus ocellatus TaxID=259542 RepID=A0AAV3Y609_9GAST|nr:transposable element p transposase [Plakobranchus ocellatus]